MRFERFICCLFWWATWLIRMLWAVRVSLLSAGVGLLLFWFVVPAQNLMSDLSYRGSFYDVLFWFGVFATTFLMWAFPIHYAARVTLDDPCWVLSAAVRHRLSPGEARAVERQVLRRYACTILVLPRVLGMLPFVALLIGIYWGAQADKGARALPSGVDTINQAIVLAVCDTVTALLFLLFVWLRKPLIRRYAETPARLDALEWFASGALALTSLYYVIAYLFPIFTSVWTPRALLVPPLFGSLVLGLSWLARWGRRTGAPVFAILVVAVICVTAGNVHFNDLRKVPDGKLEDGRLRVEAAVAQWKVANGCAGATTAKPNPCPRPVVVAIDGGASRAAFAAATFLGELLDQMPPPKGNEATTPGRRVFAISGVSGGAYGAAVIQAAVADAQTGDPHAAVRTPCRTADRTWFRNATWSGETFTWRECLQALTSGDYLSTTIIGLAFRDAFAPSGMIVDRATLLEQSFERHYDYTVRTGLNPFDGGAICGAPAETGLCRLMARPADWLKRHEGGWLPLLMLNGTSVRTGQRIVSADLASSPSRIGGNGSLYNAAFDLREAMALPCPKVEPPTPLGTRYVDDVTADASSDDSTVRTRAEGSCAATALPTGPDIRLSTAALTSARFPLISPAGAFVMKNSDPQYGDQVVDGGYFENSGITTALDIVAALREQKLDPILVSVGNDPEVDTIEAGVPRRPAATPLVLTPADGFFARAFSLLGAPLNALLATRDGHAAEALHAAQAHFPDQGFYRFRVEQTPDLAPVAVSAHDVLACHDIFGKPLTMTKVSMSWWLSATVQADLDAQRCSASNRAVTAAVLEQVTSPSQ